MKKINSIISEEFNFDKPTSNLINLPHIAWDEVKDIALNEGFASDESLYLNSGNDYFEE